MILVVHGPLLWELDILVLELLGFCGLVHLDILWGGVLSRDCPVWHVFQVWSWWGGLWSRSGGLSHSGWDGIQLYKRILSYCNTVL